MSTKLESATQPIDGKAPRTPTTGILLRVLEPSQAASVRLYDRCVVGSGDAVDLRIDDRTVSRRHAEFSIAEEGVLVRDLGSRNGSFYLDQRFETMVLSLGASVRLGRAVVSLDVDASSSSQPVLPTITRYGALIGRSSAMRRLFARLQRLEKTGTTVLIEGESGSGKELVAHAIHQASDLAGAPYVTINCGALPRDLVGSELFGHRRGAFTGADAARRGVFDLADGGTLFLDEIGDLPLEQQPVLLRALEAGEIRPLGGEATHTVAVRIIAATHRDLERAVDEGTFREDLYYRLAVVRLRVPSLRERREDVEALALHFAAEVGCAELPPEVVEHLKRRTFRGNVRELKNLVHAYLALGELSEEPSPHRASLDLALHDLVDLDRPYADQKESLVERFTRQYLTELLSHAKGNLSAAARLAGLDRGHLRRLVERHVRGARHFDDE